MDVVTKPNSSNTNNYSTQITIDKNDIFEPTITERDDRNETKNVNAYETTNTTEIINNKHILSLQNMTVSETITTQNDDIEKTMMEMKTSNENVLQKQSVANSKRSTVSQRFVDYYFNGTCSRKSPNKLYLIFYNLLMPFFVIATASCFGYLFKMPFIFPSLGPTAFLHFAIPNKPPSSPRNTLIGHLIGIIAGSLSLQITNLYYNDVIFVEGVVFERIWCASLSVGITCCLMIICHVEHPPAGATTLIVSLGILKTPFELMVMMMAVLLLTVQAFILNRLFRNDVIYPFWKTPQPKKQSNEEFDPLRGYTLRGFSDMRLSNFNIPRKKLDVMQYALGFSNFIEYFKICSDIGTIDEMRFLLQFAQQNKDMIKELHDYHEAVPFAVRVLIQGV